MRRGVSPAEALALALLPAAMVGSAALGCRGTGLWVLLTALLGVVPFFAALERERPKAREVLPVVVLAALAAGSRVLFAPFPNVKPMSAIIMTAGAALGSRAGFLTGALAALASNLFFGQGPWTPLQMYAWGLLGCLAGALSRRGLFSSRPWLCLWGVLGGLLYGVILDSWYIAAYVDGPTLLSAGAAYLAGLPGNLAHGLSTAAFLALICPPWNKQIQRIRKKYGMEEQEEPPSQGEG